MIMSEHFCSNMNWHTKSILFLNYLHLQFHIVGMIHSPFIGLSRFNLDQFVASICVHFNSWFTHFQIIRYFSRAESMYFSHFTGLYFSGVVSVVQQLSAVTSLPWQPLSAHSRRQGARKSPTDILSSALFLANLRSKICQKGGLANTTTLSQEGYFQGSKL